MLNKLKFAKGNAKLGKETAIFSLPAGHLCVGAQDCLARVNQHTGKLTDGPKTQFRCYAASNEVMFPNIRKSRWNNFKLLIGKNTEQMAAVIQRSLPRKIKLVRVHASGDFFSQAYFDAWMLVARNNPSLIFYAYTKSLPFWVYRLNEIPTNFKLNASLGGKFDSLIVPNNLKCVKVVYSEEQAKSQKLPIDHDDTLAWKQDGDFALLLHSTQPAGSIAGKALSALRAQNKGGYKASYFAHYKKEKHALVAK